MKLNIARLGACFVLATQTVFHATALTVENKYLGLDFESDGKKINLRSMVDKSDGFKMQESRGDSPLWSIQFKKKDGKVSAKFRGGSAGEPVDIVGDDGSLVTVDSLALGATVSTTFLKPDHSCLEILWDKIKLPDGADLKVRVVVDLPLNGTLSYWRISTETASQDYSVWHIDFVKVSGLARETEKKNEFYLQPAGQGQRAPVPTDGSIEWIYPSSDMTMQMSAYLLAAAGKGFFTACFDEKANAKKFNFSEEKGNLGQYWEHYPENMGSVYGKYTLPYAVVLGVFSGDWFEASQIYKQWAVKQLWVARGKISQTQEIPEWYKKINLWKRPDGDPDKVARNMEEFADWFGQPFAMQWYQWNVPGYDSLYPDVFPPRPGFKEAVSEMEKKNIHVFPYINGLLCDPKSETWQRGAEAAVAKTVDGRLYPYPTEASHWSYHMCPATQFWQDSIYNVAMKMAREAGPTGLYFDCLGGLDTKLDFDPSHGHPLGGGHYAYEGFRKMMTRIRKDYREVVPTAAFTTELMAEPMIDVFDGALMCTVDSAVQIPLINAVYGEYIFFLGRAERWEDWDQDGCFENRESEAFTFGNQLGWYPGARGSSENYELAPEFRERTGFLKTLVAGRSAAEKYMVYGAMAAPLKFESAIPLVRLEGSYKVFGGQAATKPVLYESSWKSEKGSVALVFANSSKKDVSVKYAFDPAKYGFRADRPLSFRTLYTSDGSGKGDAVNKTGVSEHEQTVKGRSVLILEVTQ